MLYLPSSAIHKELTDDLRTNAISKRATRKKQL